MTNIRGVTDTGGSPSDGDIPPIIEYGDVICEAFSAADYQKWQYVPLEAACIVTGCKRYVSHVQLYLEPGWITLIELRLINNLRNVIP